LNDEVDDIHVDILHNSSSVVKFSFLNVCGLDAKIKFPEFTDFISQYDILCFAETKLGEYDGISVPGFTFKSVIRSKCKRKSGGVGILVKDDIFEKVEILDNCSENHLWFKFKSNNCIFGVIYIPPECSNYSSTCLFDELESNIMDFSVKFDNCNFCIFGDFNAKTRTVPEFTDTDKYVADVNFDIATNQLFSANDLSVLGFPTSRVSSDKHNVDNYGFRLLDLCKFASLCIVNGRCGEDALVGKCTTVGDSIIDYVLSSVDNFPHIKHFDIGEFDPVLSDVHCPLELHFDIGNSFLPEDNFENTHESLNHSDTYIKPTWNVASREEFRNSFDMNIVDELRDELDSILSGENFNEQVVNNVTKKVTKVLFDAADACNFIETKMVSKRNTKTSQKQWFDRECKTARENYYRAKNKYRRLRTSVSHDEMLQSSKKYKKEINKKFKDFNNSIVNKLRGLKNTDPKSYWSLLNKYSGDKKTIVSNISNEAFHEHFSKLNENLADDNLQYADINLDELSYNNQMLNMPFSTDEIKKAIMSLKNNKTSSPFDFILNEYLKNANDAILPVICGLFNIILNSGVFPDIWSKGSILPLYKNKGSVNDPDNYRGISILSCFGKLFTKLLNTRLNAFLEMNNILCEEQAGFRKNYSTVDHIFSLKCLIDFYLAKNKKLFCSFIDFRKAFDSVNRAALWQKILKCNIDGKCFKIIHDMYAKAKSCVTISNNHSQFFASETGVRQGENLSPILFSMFLNDLNDFLSTKYAGLQRLSQSYDSTLNNDSIEVLFRLFMLLYADDTVILAENAQELQSALDAMSEYCNVWGLKVNTTKTKIVVFWKSKRGLRGIPTFTFENRELELVDHFSYLGVKFSFNGRFNMTKKHLIDQARKAMFSVIRKSRKLCLPIDMQLSLFNAMVAPVILYGSEVWGIENVDIVDRFQLKYCKSILNLKQSTPNCMVYGELGITPLSLQIKARVLNYWCKLVNGKKEKISVMLYNMLDRLFTCNEVKTPWVKFVHDTLNSLGMSNFMLDNHIPSPNQFKCLVNTRLNDQFLQNWHSSVENSSKCLNYRIYKETLVFEDYFKILPFNLATTYCKFRCMNHRMPIESGRFMNIERNQRFCLLCNNNLIGDEFHYIFNCSFFNIERKKYVNEYFTKHPNAIKFKDLMNSKDKSVLLKLSVFCKKIIQGCNAV